MERKTLEISVKNLVLIIALFTMSKMAFSVCTSPISRTNFTSLQVLGSTRLNLELNTVYSRSNELPGDCITINTIPASKLITGSITNTQIAANAGIVSTKLAAPNMVISTLDSDLFTTNSAAYVDVTNLTVTITTLGRPVEVFLIPKAALPVGSDSGIKSTLASGSYAGGTVRFVRGTTDLANFKFEANMVATAGIRSITTPIGGFRHMDFPAAGTYTYKVMVSSAAGGVTALDVSYVRLVVREL